MNTTEQAARESIAGIVTELAELCDGTNDDNPAPWEMARQKAAELFHVMDTVCVQLYARRGQEAPAIPASTRIYLNGRVKVNHRETMTTQGIIPTKTPEEAEELDRIEQSHPTPGGLHPVFEDLVKSMRRGA